MYRVWDYVRQNDEVGKLKSKIAYLEARNKELNERLEELRSNFEPLPMPWRENGVFSQEAKNQLLENIEELVYPQHCKDINLLVIGHIGSGKSALVNTFFTVLRNNGQLAIIAPPSPQNKASVTPMLHEIVLQNIPGTKTLRVYDCRGILPDKSGENKNAVFMKDLQKVIEGNVVKDYRFDENCEIQENDDCYNNNPTISDKMHCVLFVVNACNIDEEKDVTAICSMQSYLFRNNIPSRMILSHVDQLDMCVYGDLTKLFVSRHVQKKVELAKRIFSLQDTQVLPVANYVKGTTQTIAQDILALQAIENIMNETISYVGNMSC